MDFDANGKPCFNSYHFAGWKATYDDRGNMVSRVCLDAGGKPCLSIDGFAGFKATFDERGNQTSFSYFGMKGEPIIAPKRGFHRIVTSYDPNGKVLEEKYFDCQGKPLTLAETHPGDRPAWRLWMFFPAARPRRKAYARAISSCGMRAIRSPAFGDLSWSPTEAEWNRGRWSCSATARKSRAAWPSVR